MESDRREREKGGRCEDVGYVLFGSVLIVS